MQTLAEQFARESGYTGSSPAMLAAFEAIRQSGIRQARNGHFQRLKKVREYAANPALYFAAIRPALSTDEAIEDANRFLASYRNMPTWQRQNRVHLAAKAKQARVVARFFRRFGSRIWQREAA